ncbi:MAG: hypothetical protein IPJ41_18470 [Phycisphaerales bacterium]|nr:hypothetical protein [Phycisphaerales bacterium]
MSVQDWTITIGGVLLAAASLILLAWAVLWDGLRTRRARRAGGLRRCPRCWYDMAGVAGLRCPECGRSARRERSLVRPRRRWRWVIGAVPLLAAGLGIGISPWGKGGAWHRWVPDGVVIRLIPRTTADGWALNEILRRLGSDGQTPVIDDPGRLSAAEWRLLTRKCLDALRADPPPPSPSSYLAAACSSPEPETAFDDLLSWITGGTQAQRRDACIFLPRIRFFLDVAQLAQADRAWGAMPEDSSEFYRTVQANDRARFAAHLASRQDPERARRLAAIRSIPTTPESMIEAVDGRSISEWVAMERRLGVRCGMLVDTDDASSSAIEVERIDLCIDDNESRDCILLISNRDWEDHGSRAHYDALVLLQAAEGWRFLARIGLSNCLDDPPGFRSVRSADGKRWLVVRHDRGSSNDGTYCIKQDAWYRVKGDRLLLEQAVMPRAFSSSRFHQTLEPCEPKVIRRGGRYLASYDIESMITLAVPGADGPERLTPIAEDRGTFEYPLGVPDTRLGQFVPPGPWAGRDCWWAILDDPQILSVCKPRLLAIAHSDDPAERSALRAVIDNYLSFLSPTPEIAEIQAALDEP